MATKTVTVDTNEWKYIDSFGDPHTITNAQAFTFTLTDGGEAAVSYNIDAAQTVTTTDGYTIYFRPEVDGGNTARTIHYLADAKDGVVHHDLGGELVVECPVSGNIQRWRVAKLTVNNVDAPTAITAATFEDQYGNVMTIPNTGAGITVA